MLTLYYATATFLQSWRIKKVCTKIGQELAQKMSVSFYTLPPGSDDGFDPTLAASDLCYNRNAARVSEILWLSGAQRGCCLSPLQVVQLMPWISFGENISSVDTMLLPFAHSPAPTALLERLATANNDEILHLLLETGTQPCTGSDCDLDFVRIENFGKLIAWKVDSHLAVLIETDVEHFTKLLLSTYLQNNFIINDQLQLLRIESINYEGKPQPLNLLASHLRKPVRNSEQQLSADEWQRHLDDLRALSVLAHQATEFVSQKSRAEVKSVTGVAVKPDLIPYEQQMAGVVGETKTSNSKEIEAAAVNKDEKSSTELPSIKTASNVTPTRSAMVTKVPTEREKSINNTSASGKTRAKPTEIKKPAAAITSSSGGVGESRFKTTKISEPAKSEHESMTTTEVAAIKSPEPSAKLPLIDPPITISAAAAVITTTIGRAKLPSSCIVTESSELKKLPSETLTQKQKQKSPTSEVTQVAPEVSKTDDETKPSISTSASASSNAALFSNNGTVKRPSLKRYKNNARPSKPTNIFVYSESVSSRESALNTLKEILEHDKYTIYAMTPQQLTQKYWIDNTALMVVCGTVPTNIGEILVDYFLCGGKVLSLCSDILNFILPNYRTAEVRENELVQFSYDKWQKIKMMHHIFCYQPSPVKKNFSTDSDDATQSSTKKPALVCPRSVELQDLHGEVHNLDVKVLGFEETWNTPSLLLANNAKSGGCAVFSQVHLETNPSQFELDELKYNILKQNEQIRLEILADVLSKHLDVSVQQLKKPNEAKITYQEAYFLGRHESKFELLNKLKKSAATGNIVITSKLTMQFCDKGDKPKSANTNVLPILIHSCPEDFSTVDYFDNLKTNYIGRLVIYAPIVSTSMNVVSDLELTDGIAVLVRQQTEGVGRSNNQWLSPLGCAMFSIQLHISLDTALGGRLPLLQHIIGLAVVNTLKGNETYKPFLVKQDGYPIEEHKVQTSDDYILTMHRIPFSPKLNNSATKRPVAFLMHGIACASSSWVLNGPDSSLAYILSDAGYDVWMGNARGNVYSKEHRSLSPLTQPFWNFTWHEIGIYDIPAMINYALNMTGDDKVHYIGHSQGTTTFFVLNSLSPSFVEERIRSVHLLAPIVFMSNSQSPVLKTLGPVFGQPNPTIEITGSIEFLPSSSAYESFAGEICKDGGIIQPACSNLLFLLVGGASPYLNTSLDIRLKWPNDIYADGVQKIGGLIVKTTMCGSKVIVNLGCGINLDNAKPTTCINSMIREYNNVYHAKMPLLKYEEFVALTFNEIERLLEKVKLGDFEYFYELYYKLWMHESQKVKICDKSGKQQEATIIGIDDVGYLKVKTVQGIETVQPDGNSFDMLQGLIVPKFN